MAGNQEYLRIKSSNALPSPAGVALEILRIAGDDDATIGEIARVVEADPATASRLLRYVNSPMAGMPRPINSVQHAITLLGLHTVKIIALGFSLLSQKGRTPCATFDHEAFWSDALARATAMRNLTARLDDLVPDEAFVCGLLSSVGSLALATVYPEAYSQLQQSHDRSDPESLPARERKAFGIDHVQLSAEMMQDWGLSDALCDAVRYQRNPEDCTPPAGETHKLCRLLRLAGSIAAVLTSPTIDQKQVAEMLVLSDRFNILPDRFEQVFESIRDEWTAMGSIFEVQTSHAPALQELYAVARQLRTRLERDTVNADYPGDDSSTMAGV